MGREHHRYYKHNKFRKNPRGDPKFLVDLTWNDPNDRPSKYSNRMPAYITGSRLPNRTVR